MTQGKRSGPREHELKTWPAFFQAILDGDKNFEVRKNDRGFQKGDTLWLREYDTSRLGIPYTRREVRVEVTYVLSGFGLQDGYVVMGLR